MSERIVMRVGEALVAGGPPGTAAEPEIVIGELDGPVGRAFAQLIGDQVKGHSRVLAIMNTDIMVKPATLMVSKVTVKKERYTNILMGTVQAAIANGVLDAVRQGDILRACLPYFRRACLSLFCAPARRKERGVVLLHKRLTTPPGRKTARPACCRQALRVRPQTAPLGVACRSFGVTKFLSAFVPDAALPPASMQASARLDWRRLGTNRHGENRVNRP